MGILVGCGAGVRPEIERPVVTERRVVVRPEPVVAEVAPVDDAFERFVDEVGEYVVGVMAACVEDEAAVKPDVRVDFRVDVSDPTKAWLVGEAVTTAPVMAAVEDCVSQGLARSEIEWPPAPARLVRTSFHAGITTTEDGRRIVTHGQLELFDVADQSQ
jgi:hypothetical protein